MATIRQRKKEVDIDFPLESIWQAIPVAVNESGWVIEEKRGCPQNGHQNGRYAYLLWFHA
jgi:hypothetical protein